MKYVIYSIGMLLMSACTQKHPGYHKTPEGLYRKVFKIGDDIPLSIGDFIVYDLNVFESDSLVYAQTSAAIQINKHEHPFFSKALLDMNKGDSACYIYEKTPEVHQLFCVEVHQVFKSEKAYQDHLMATALKAEQKEHQRLSAYIEKSERVWYNILGIYSNTFTRFKQQNFKGDTLSILYKGYSLDGHLYEDQTNRNAPFEFTYGNPGQVIRGIEIAVSMMQSGEKLKFILPSLMAYGSEGSSDYSVAPFTPLLYEIELVEVKKKQ